MLTSIALAIAAAILIGIGLVQQQYAAERAPKAYFLRLRLITELFRQRRWLFGIVIMVSGQILSAWTFDRLDLSLAEPLLATELLFALVVAVPLTGVRLQKSELLGAILLSLGVAALSVSRTVNAQGVRFGSAAYWPSAAVVGVIALCLVRAGLHRSGQQRATLTGIASGLVFGISDALTRRTLMIITGHSLLTALSSWPPYCLVAASLTGMWLMQSAFNAAPLHASLPGITAAEPVTGMLLGVIVFGDVVRISPGLLALQAAGIVALVTGVILVARAPALSSLRPRQLAEKASAKAEALQRRVTHDAPGRHPVSSQPATGQPATEQPATGQPTTGQPATDHGANGHGAEGHGVEGLPNGPRPKSPWAASRIRRLARQEKA